MRERDARVVSVGRNAAWIVFEDETAVRLAALRKNEERTALVPGDLVRATPLDDERVVVERILPRSFALQRTTAGGRTKTIAANVDAIAITTAFARPAPHLAMIDELAAFAELHAIDAIVIFTKPDLAEAGERERLPALYRKLGYQTFVVNPKAGDGVEDLTADLTRRHTLLIGQSGVGKSSLFRALGGSGDVGDVSRSGRGRQTTTSGRLHRFAAGFLIDSPGFSEFQLEGIAARDIGRGFVEFATTAGHCRFGDCLHRSEPGCAVLARLATGEIAASRYASYCGIVGRIV